MGNYGVGKSTLIFDEILSQEKFILNCKNGWSIVGNTVDGADSLSSFSKTEIFDTITKYQKNLIITGNYYCQIKDIERMVKTHKVAVVYLKTSFENNAFRIAKRGRAINVKTYNSKLTAAISALQKIKKIATVNIIDNNREKRVIKDEFFNYIQNF